MGEFLDQLALPGGVAGSVEGVVNQLSALLNGIIQKIVAYVPESLMALYNVHTVTCLLAVICALALVAFEGYRFLRMLTYTGTAFLLGVVGYRYVAPVLPDAIKAIVPENWDYKVLVAVVCALVAVLLCRVAFNLVIFAIGGVAGYLIGANYIYGILVSRFNSLDFLQTENVKYIVGGVIAAVSALAFILVFKLVFMLGTSFVGSIGASLIIGYILVPNADYIVKICFVALGIVVGIFAMVRQHREEQNIIFSV